MSKILNKFLSIGIFTIVCCTSSYAQDPLPSWNDTPVKSNIINYINTITDPSSPLFVPQDHRIAALDLDGTLITEWPINFQRALAVNKLKESPHQSILASNHLFYNHKSNHSQVFLSAFNNTTQEQYHDYIANFLKTQKDPHWNVHYDELFYQPGIELVRYLEDNGFIIYIVSTTEVECIRQLLSHKLSMEPVQIIGNEVVRNVSIKGNKVKFTFTDRFRQPENRAEQKCAYCNYRVGEPPIFGFGNSSGDSALLKMVDSSSYPSFVMILDHDDPVRELKYHDESLIKDAKKYNWDIVSMKRDFKTVHTSPPSPRHLGLDITPYLK